MGAIQFISSNPTTAAIRTNEARDLQQAQAAESLLAARDVRQQRTDADANAGIAAEALMVKPRPSMLATAAPQQPPQGDGMLAPVAPTAGTYSADKPKASPLASVTADDPYSNAITSLKGRRGSGAMQLQLAQAQQKQNATAHAEAIKAFGTGDFELAQALNQRHGLGLDAVFNNPSALQTSRMLAGSIQHLKLEPAQSIAYMDAATQKFAEVYGQTRDPKQAMGAAGAAGMSAAKLIRPKGTGNLVETPDGYFNRDTGDYEKGKDGKVLRVPDRRLNFNPSGGGGAGGSPKAVATMEWKSKSYQALGISPELSNAIAANPGFATTPQAVQKQAQFIQKASADVMGRPTKTADQAMQEARQLMQGAQSMALETMGGASPVTPSAPAAPQGRVRKYVPGQGFVDQQ